MISVPLDQRVRAMLRDEFSTIIWNSSVEVLNSRNKLRAHFFAAGVREIWSHNLHTRAPDEDVMAANWYSREALTPTRKQRAKFSVQGGLPDEIVEELGLDLEGMYATLSQATSELNKRTHVRPNTLLQDPPQISAFAENAALALLDFFDTIDSMRGAVADAVTTHLQAPLFEKALEGTIVEIDELATHHTIDDIQIETIKINSIGAYDISYDIEGIISVELLYGSGSDRERGEGASMKEQFPFKAQAAGSVSDLDKIERVSEMEVDVSSWYED